MNTEIKTEMKTEIKTEMKKPLIEISNLVKNYKQKSMSFFKGDSGAVTAVNKVDLTLYEGETLGLVGESGCGKSTLGKAVLQLVKPTGGSIRFSGTEMTSLSDKQLREKRTDMQYIFQDPKNCLNSVKTVGWILEEPLIAHGIGSKEQRKTIVSEMLSIAGLSEKYLNRYPRELSGGQAQRIVILSALILKPKFVVADEAVSALDVSIQAQVLNFINELKANLGLTMLFITHDLSVCHYMSDRIAVMYLGNIVEIGDADILYSGPMHPYTKMLFSSAMKTIDNGKTYADYLGGADMGMVQTAAGKGCPFCNRCNEKMPVCESSFPELYDTGDRNVRCFNFENNKK